MKNHVKNYQDIWSFIIQNKKELYKGYELEEHYVSLSEQYTYLLFNNDQIIKLEEKPSPDNDDVFLMTYFTYNFILSAKSILDVFAWIIKETFLVNVSLRDFDVSIIFKSYRNDKQNKHNSFKKACEGKVEAKLYAYLCLDTTQKFFSNLEKHRDIVSHKGKIHIVRYDNKDTGEVTIVKPKDPEVFRTIKWREARKKDSGDDMFEMCSQFANGIIASLNSFFIQMNDSVLRHLQIHKLK